METSIYLSEFERKVLKLVDSGYYVSKIARELKVSKSKVSKTLKRLEKNGIVVSIPGYPRFYKLSEYGRMLLHRDVSTVANRQLATFHKVCLVGGILHVDVKLLGRWDFRRVDGVDVYSKWFGDVYVEIWLGDRLGASFKAWVDKIEVPYIRFWSGLSSSLLRIVSRLVIDLIKEGVVIDPNSIRISWQEIANQLPKQLIDQKLDYYKIFLGYTADGPTGKLNTPAVAWLDGTPYRNTLESNDLNYEEKLILMPLLVYNLHDYLNEYNRNIKEHLAAIQDIRNYIRELRDLQRRPSLLSHIYGIFKAALARIYKLLGRREVND